MDAKNALYFCGGVVLGVAGTIAFLWFWDEDAVQNDIPEEALVAIEPEPRPKTVDKSTLDDTLFDVDQRIDYNAIVTGLYNNDSTTDIPQNRDDIRRVSDSEFQSLSTEGNYDSKSLTLYSDGILADSISDEVMSESDAFAALGPNFTERKLQRIFTLEKSENLDVIYVRNDRLYTLYEVTTDDRTYKEVTGGGD